MNKILNWIKEMNFLAHPVCKESHQNTNDYSFRILDNGSIMIVLERIWGQIKYSSKL